MSDVIENLKDEKFMIREGDSFKNEAEMEAFIESYGRANAAVSEKDVREFLTETYDSRENSSDPQSFYGRYCDSYGSIMDALILWGLAKEYFKKRLLEIVDETL